MNHLDHATTAAQPTRRRWLAAALLSFWLLGCAPLPAQNADPLPSWNAGANKARIIDFVRGVTTTGSQDFVPAAERIAVFDNDGTLWLEQPLYTQVLFAFDRIRTLARQHPEWQTTEPFKSLLAGDMKGVMAGGEKGLLEIVFAAQSGISTSEFDVLVKQWLGSAKDSRFKRQFTDLTYLPMRELLAYLRANGFATYIVTGGTVDFVRAFADGSYGVPTQQVLGTRQKLAYEVRQGTPQVMMLPQVEFVDDGPGKPVNIASIIGKRPIAAFGNSDGDYEMLQWTSTGAGARLAMIVHHDDAVREYAYDRNSSIGKLVRGLDDAKANGWQLISMKNDWATIFSPAK